MALTKSEVAHVAMLARIELNEKELAGLQGELNNILDYVDQLQELDLSHVEPTTHAVGMVNSMRADVPVPSLSQEAALLNAPEVREGAYLIPRIVAPGLEDGDAS